MRKKNVLKRDGCGRGHAREAIVGMRNRMGEKPVEAGTCVSRAGKQGKTVPEASRKTNRFLHTF